MNFITGRCALSLEFRPAIAMHGWAMNACFHSDRPASRSSGSDRAAGYKIYLRMIKSSVQDARTPRECMSPAVKLTDERPIQVVLLGASLNTGNMGLSALTAGTITSVLNTFPNARFFLLDYAREPGTYTLRCRNSSINVELVNIRFSKKFFLRNNIARLLAEVLAIKLLPRSGWKQSLLESNPYFKRILSADIVASIAGGDSFSDIYGLSRLLYMALPQILVLQLKKPLILLPQTLGPFRGLMAKIIAGYIMRRAAMVYSRDRTSFEEAGRLLGQQRDKLRFSHDMAFVLEPVRPDENKLADLPQRDDRTPLVGINVSGLLFMGGYNRDNMFGLKVDYARLLHDVIERLVREHGANVILVPHVFGSDAESDTLACAHIFKQLEPEYGKQLHLLRGDFNQHEIKYVIGQCDFFLGSRMHACIAALSQCIPAACLAYSRKFIGVMESIGCAELVTDLCFLDNEESLRSIFHIFDSRLRIREQLLTQIPTARASVLSVFSHQNLS